MITRELLYSYILKRNLSFDSSSLREAQLKKFRAMVRYAYENVPFYHKRFEERGLKPDDIASMDDLTKIPITTKSQIQSCPLQDLVSRTVNLERCVMRSTSGSVGMPLTIAVSDKVIDFEGAMWHRALSENGLGFRDRMSIIGDPRSFPRNRRFFENFDVLKRQYISLFDNAGTQLTLLEQFKPQAIKGYPSSLTILADFCKQRNIALSPRLIFTTSEVLDRESREFISSVFEAELTDYYASQEFALLAWECDKHIGYHMNIDGVVMEFVKDGEAVSPSERGEILCTSLFNETMPLIRYEIGDMGIPIEEQCSCGNPLPLMKIVEGRMDDFLVAMDGRMISPAVFFPYPFRDIKGIKQFRVIQKSRDKLIIQMVIGEDFLHADRTLEEATENVRRLFGEKMKVEFQVLEKINRDQSGKLRKVVSNLAIREYAWKHTH
jgi:phenylacetate-CoA ligase